MKEPGVGISDASLVERARRGNAAAFEGLVRRHYRAAFAVALSLVSGAMDAEDVCQDAFVRALERLEDCRKPDRFRAWLLQIVRNRAHNYREYQLLREGQSVEHLTLVGTQEESRHAERTDLRERLEGALAELTEKQREVVLLHDLEGWKHREIAEQLGISEGMSRQHLFAARRALRELLGEHALEEYLHD